MNAGATSGAGARARAAAGAETTWNDVEILVVGAGTMGASLAQAYAQNGFHVGLLDVSEPILEAGFATIERELESAVRAGIYSPAEAGAMRKRIIATTSYEEACGGAALELVVEAATERLEVKKKIFADLDRLCRPETVLATNSSSLDVNVLAAVTKRPDRVVWMHYFYLPHKNRAGEYAGSDAASAESMATARRYLKLGGKIPTLIRGSRRGGAADIIFVALLHEATRMVEEGHDFAAIEAAGRKAYGMPMGFLVLMDETGVSVGLHAMRSFSEPTGPDDGLIRSYAGYYKPLSKYVELVGRLEKGESPRDVRWVTDPKTLAGEPDPTRVKQLCERFQGVGFAASCEVVDAGLITREDLERLCQNAFLWRRGPFTLMNRMGTRDALRVIQARAEQAAKEGGALPVSPALVELAEKGQPWPLDLSAVQLETEEGGARARVTISSPTTANAMDNDVLDALERAFRTAYEDPSVQAVIFDSAPIKTFIAGASIPGFVEKLRAADTETIRRDTERWQEIIFHVMTGGGKPKVAIVDGQAFGGGVEVALAFAADPDTVTIATERTRYALPETRLGIFPGLRGTLTLAEVIHRATGDAELALAMARYYTLAGGTPTSSPRLLRHLGLVDLLVPARRRDEVASVVAAALAGKKKGLTREELDGMGIAELPHELDRVEREELRLMKELFLKPDLVPLLYAYGRGWSEPQLNPEARAAVVRVARRAAVNSPHAVAVADLLINRGFARYLAGDSMDARARWELERFLVPVFEHPDALEGLSAMLERRFPDFNRRHPL